MKMLCRSQPGAGMKLVLLLKLLQVILLRVEAAHYIQTTKEDCEKVIPLSGEEGSFTSPGGYEGYPNNTNCSWIMEVDYNAKIIITFHDFDLEYSKTCAPYDFVKVTDMCNKSKEWSENIATSEKDSEGYCGTKTSSLTVQTRCQKARVQFGSDDSVTKRGFNATFKVIRVPKAPEIISFCPVGEKNCSTRKELTETDTEVITCQVSASPAALVYWSYRGLNENNNDSALDTHIIDNHDGTLKFKNLRRNDTGFYRCYANNTQGDDDALMYLRVKEKCKCPTIIKANWYDIPPYIKDEGPGREPSGLFPLLLKEIVPLCCGNCSGGDGPSFISYLSYKQENLVDIKKIENLGGSDVITFPISGKKDERWYQNEYKFMPLVSSPGVAFIVVDEPPGTSANAVFNSVLSGWPVLLLTLLMALLSGIIIWGLDTWYNPEEFPRSFIKGSGEGFWWAFVTMTTVGYGDRSPRGFVARIFAIGWVLVGLVITSIFTGVVTTSLTAITLSTDVKLYGTTIAAVANSTEYRLGLNKNAHMKAYHDLQSIVEPLKNREDGLKGVLVDTYVAGAMGDFSSDELRVNKIIDHNSYYGVVFGRDGRLAGKDFQTCFEDYFLSNQAAIFETVKKYTQPMKEPSESAAVERSSGLFDASSPLFQKAVYTCLGLLLFFAACGIIWDYGYMRHWKKKAEMDELELLGGPGYEMAKRNLDMMDALMQEVQEFYENWTKRLDDITNKHEEEQRLQAKQRK